MKTQEQSSEYIFQMIKNLVQVNAMNLVLTIKSATITRVSYKIITYLSIEFIIVYFYICSVIGMYLLNE